MKVILLAVFGAAMAFVEATVVVYLRKLYFPGNFIFPINVSAIPSQVIAIEWVREACTIVMLLAIAVIAGKKFQDKFAYFIYSFAVWDIFYYIWLRVLLGWPSSLMAWDILFLIPVTWGSPVLAPVLVSCTMIVLAAVILKEKRKKIISSEWILLISSVVLFYVSFVWDYSLLLLKKGFLVRFTELAINPASLSAVSDYTPTTYHWEIFILAEILASLAIFSFCKRAKLKQLVRRQRIS